MSDKESYDILMRTQHIILSSQKLADLHEATTLSVHFKDLTCIKYRRDMYMTWDGLLGGLNLFR